MKIEFYYVNGTDCNLLNKEYGHWGCCCKCANQLEVYKHCCHVNDKQKDELNVPCNCGQSLKFYVCTCFAYEEPKASVCGLHGVCEMFHERKVK